MELVGNTPVSYQSDHLIHHIPAAGHHEANVISLADHLGGRIHKKLRSLLHGDPPQKGYNLLRYARLTFNGINLGTKGIYCIVYGGYLPVGLVVIFDNSLTCQIAHTYNVIAI